MRVRVFLGGLAGVIIGFSLALGHNVLAKRNYEAPLPITALQNFSEIFARIQSDYVETVDQQKLMEEAIRGMVSSLDPHSAYLSPSELEDLTVDTSGLFGGLGIEVTMEDKLIKVIAPIDDTPAQRAGIQSGDLIVRIDDTAVRGLKLSEAVNLMRGKPGTAVTLTIMREGAKELLTVKLMREIIRVQSVKSRMLETGFGYIRLTQFQNQSVNQLRAAIEKLVKENGGALQGLILDLRNNPGGVLNGAIGVADLFLDKGLIVSTKGRASEGEMRYSARPGDILAGAPLVVLVNAGSASASEIVAGALQDHKRAVIMGSTTFGKGSVQTIQPLSNGGALKLTTALYYTPNNVSIQAAGIKPDIILRRKDSENKEQTSKNLSIDALKEADLKGHLNGELEGSSEAEKGDDQAQKRFDENDYQIIEALNLLKGLAIFRKAAQ
jgi:carboxyl-terminal processing protease